MRSRIFRILIAIAWFAWTGVIIPGHTRGIIPVAGTGATATSSHSCCDAPADRSETPKKCPTAANCAICELAVKLSGPIVLTIELKPVGLLELLPPPAPATFIRCEVPLVRACRDLPAV